MRSAGDTPCGADELCLVGNWPFASGDWSDDLAYRTRRSSISAHRDCHARALSDGRTSVLFGGCPRRIALVLVSLGFRLLFSRRRRSAAILLVAFEAAANSRRLLSLRSRHEI